MHAHGRPVRAAGHRQGGAGARGGRRGAGSGCRRSPGRRRPSATRRSSSSAAPSTRRRSASSTARTAASTSATAAFTADGIRAAIPAIKAFITAAHLVPYDVPARRGELKQVLVTLSPDGQLMMRFVLRSTESLARIRKHLPRPPRRAPERPRRHREHPLPIHAALLEGEEEHVLTAADALPMRVGGLELLLPPKSFFQTNTAIAAGLYAQAAEWAGAIAWTRAADLYLRRRRLRTGDRRAGPRGGRGSRRAKPQSPPRAASRPRASRSSPATPANGPVTPTSSS